MSTDRLTIKVSPEKMEAAKWEMWQWIIENIADKFPVDLCDEPVERIIKVLQCEEVGQGDA